MLVRADRFLIARTTIACPRCAAPTEVIALALPPGHETDESDESGEADDEAIAEASCWMPAAQTAFLFSIDHVSPAVQMWLKNHCIECGSAIDDQELFSEPGHAFVPTSAAEARKVSLTSVDRPIQASVDGYAHEPEFFTFMTRL